MAEQAASGQQDRYTTAAQQVSLKAQEKTDQQAAFDAHMGAIQQLSTCHAFPKEKLEEGLTSYFNVPPDVATFNQQKATFQDQKDTYHDAVFELEEATRKLAESRGALKDSYCNMLVSMQTGCNVLDSCYQAALKDFEDVRGKAEANMKLRKDAYAAGEAATEHLKLLLGLDASVGAVEPRYEVEFPTLVPQDACSVDTMESRQNWEEFLDVSSCDLPQVSDSYPFMGCFFRTGYVRPYGDVPSTIEGVQQCRDRCHEGGFSFFGMECPHQGVKVHCQCGQSITGTHVEDSDCSGGLVRAHCKGPFVVSGSIGEYYLGAASTGSIYRTTGQAAPKPEPTPVPQPTFIASGGCSPQGPWYDVKHGMSAEDCQASCEADAQCNKCEIAGARCEKSGKIFDNQTASGGSSRGCWIKNFGWLSPNQSVI